MKKKFHISLVVAFLCLASSANSQNSYKAFNFDSTAFHSIEVSEGFQISAIDDRMERMKSFVVYREIKNLPSATKNNHHLTIHIEGELRDLMIGNGDDFFDWISLPDRTSSFTWNGSHLKEGIYFYGIYSKEGAVRGKIVK